MRRPAFPPLRRGLAVAALLLLPGMARAQAPLRADTAFADSTTVDSAAASRPGVDGTDGALRALTPEERAAALDRALAGTPRQKLDALLREQARQGAVLDSFVQANRPTRTQAVLAWVWPVLGALAALFVLLALLGNALRRRR